MERLFSFGVALLRNFLGEFADMAFEVGTKDCQFIECQAVDTITSDTRTNIGIEYGLLADCEVRIIGCTVRAVDFLQEAHFCTVSTWSCISLRRN
ncbi:hypothetical protein ATN79_06240 [Paraburkholderia caribensis]|nr:hypothetical protein ATN79_06240 [Paraburkholderia caribensis]